MERGEVFLVPLELPDGKSPTSTTVLHKYVVILQAGRFFDTQRDVAVVLASTNRMKPGQQLRPFEVLVGVADGFDHDTVIDCRWVRTVPRAIIPATRKTRLSPTVMNDIGAAIVFGLQL